MSRTLLQTESLSKRYCRDPKLSARYAIRDILNDIRLKDNRDWLRQGEFWALRDGNISVEAGEVLGIIGHNGAGKSTLINITAGILRPTVGRVTLHTDRVVLMDHQGGLSPVQTGRENIGNQLSLHGMEDRGIADCMDEVIAYSELGDFIDAPVGTYSLGMKIRLAFAIYSRLQPDLFIVDEALNGGDLRFRMKFQRFLNEFIEGGGSILLASHDLMIVQMLCRRCVLMDKGQVRMIGDTESVIHAYTELSGATNAAAWQTMDRSDISLPGTDMEDTGQRMLPASECFDIVRIESVEITAPDGGCLQPSGPATVRVVCNSREEVSSILWAVEIGLPAIFPIATLIGGYSAPQYALKRGCNEFCCHIDRLPLLPGVYQLGIGFLKKENGVLLGFKGYHDAPVNFEIKGHPDPTMNMAFYRKSMMHIPVCWE